MRISPFGVGRRMHAAGVQRSRGGFTSSRLLALVAFLLAAYCFAAWSPPRFGDGFEYLGMSEAFVNHGTPDLRINDLREIIRRNHGDPTLTRFSKETMAHLEQGVDYFGFYPGRDARFYSYHFWVYSLLNAPALAICQTMDWPPRNSFLLTNCLLFFGMAALVLFGTDWHVRRKLLLLALALGCGTTFYLRAAAPESMCFSLVVAGLVLLETRRCILAMVSFAIAAQQNPPIGLLAVVAGGMALWQLFMRSKQPGSRKDRHPIAKFSALLAAGLVLVASPLFYYAHFGVPNLIIKSGITDPALISGYRLESLFFDWNQGMFLAMPGVFLATAVLLVSAWGKSARSRWLALALVASMLAMAIPTLTQANWNAGCAIILRYAYWLSAPLVYACAMLMDAVAKPRVFASGAVSLLASQVAILAGFGVQGLAYDYVETSPIVTWLLQHHPGWYRPIPEIFVERGMHSDGMLRPGFSYLYVQHGYLKVALSQSNPTLALQMLCRVDQGKLHSHASEQGWRYWEVKKFCRSELPDGLYGWPDAPPLVNSSPKHPMVPADPFLSDLLPGFDKVSASGTWTRARMAAMPLLVPLEAGAAPGTPWRITLAFWPYIKPPGVPTQQVFVSVNRHQVLQERYAQSRPQTMSFVAEPQTIGTRGAFLLVFRIPTAASPAQLGVSRDPRQMGIKLTDIRADRL